MSELACIKFSWTSAGGFGRSGSSSSRVENRGSKVQKPGICLCWAEMQQQLVVAARPQRRLRVVGDVEDEGTSAVDVQDGLVGLLVALEALLLPQDVL